MKPPLSKDEIISAIVKEFAPAYRVSELLTRRDWLAGFTRAMGRPRELERLMRRLAPERRLDSGEIRDAWRDYLKEEAASGLKRRDLHFYLHIPFCKQKCAYCSYHSVPLTESKRLDDYLDRVFEMISFYSSTFSGRSFQSLYFGGGTPSILSPAQMERLLKKLHDSFAFDKKGQKTVECNPVSAGPEFMRVLRDNGINRVSMGVQTFRQDSLMLENRGYQDKKMVAAALRAIRDAGGLFLNVDLLLGMRGDTKDSFLKTMDSMMEMMPDSIVVYMVQPTKKYLGAFYDSDPSAFSNELYKRFSDVPAPAKTLARKRGFRWKREPILEDVEWILRCRDSDVPFTTIYSDYTEDPSSLFGLGPTARSRIAGRLSYEEQTHKTVKFDPAERLNKSERVPPLTEEARFALMSLWRARAFSQKEFRAYFGKDIDALFPKAMGALKEKGEVVVKGDRLIFTSKSPQELFEQALRFMDIEKAVDGLFGGELELSAGEKTLRLSVEELGENDNYLEKSGGIGLRVLSEINSVFSGPAYEPMLKLLKTLFLKAAAKGLDNKIPAVAKRFKASLKQAAGRLGLDCR